MFFKKDYAEFNLWEVTNGKKKFYLSISAGVSNSIRVHLASGIKIIKDAKGNILWKHKDYKEN
jgi:hypothetical protein